MSVSLGARIISISTESIHGGARPFQAFVSYLRSVYLQKDKSIFKLDELPVERFAEALGLPGMPKIKFLSKEIAKKRKNAPRIGIEVNSQVSKPHEARRAESDDEDGLSEHSSSEEEPDAHSKVRAQDHTVQDKVLVLFSLSLDISC